MLALSGAFSACTKAARPSAERALTAPSAAPSSASGEPPPAPLASAVQRATVPTTAEPRPPLLPFEGGPGAVASSDGIVVAVEKLAAEVGAGVLADGGNAVDAAVATAAIGVTAVLLVADALVSFVASAARTSQITSAAPCTCRRSPRPSGP